MTWRSRLWFAGVAWALPVSAVLGVWYVASSSARPGGQAVSSTVAASEATALMFPFLAAAASWVAARLRAAGSFVQQGTRRATVVTAEALLPLIAGGYLAYLVVVGYAMNRDQSWGWPGATVPVVYLLILTATCTWGYALGRWLRPWIALPLSLIATFVVLGFPPALNPLWLQHLFGINGLCCDINKSVNTHVAAASALVATGALAAAALLVAAAPRGLTGATSNRSRLMAVTAAVLALSAASTAAVSLVHRLGPEPVQPRAPSAIKCTRLPPADPTNATVQVCTWPEHLAIAPDYTSELHAVAMISVAAGLPPLTRFTEGQATPPTDGPMRFEPHPSATDRAVVVADEMASQPERCYNLNTPDPVNDYGQSPSPDTTDPTTTAGNAGDPTRFGNDSFTVSLVLRQWWRQQVARPLNLTLPPPPGLDIDPVAQTALKNLAAEPPTRQGQWVHAVTVSRQSCGANFLPPPP